MGDLFVHVRMKECCRKVLKQLDGKKKKVRPPVRWILDPSVSLASLGEMPVTEAARELANLNLSGSTQDGDMEQVVRKICSQLCERHVGEHQGTEASFWLELSRAFLGEPESLYEAKIKTSVDGVSQPAPGTNPLDIDIPGFDGPNPLNLENDKPPGFKLDPGIENGPSVDMLFPNPSKNKVTV